MRTKTLTPKVIHRRKLGHLWQVQFGMPGKLVVYGYAPTKSEARINAALTFFKYAKDPKP